MNPSGSEGGWLLASSLRLLALWALAMLAAGTISALTTVARMRRSGMLGEEVRLAGASLIDGARSVLLTLSLVFFAGASLAASELPSLVRALDPAPPAWVWVAVWLGYLGLTVVAVVAVKALALDRPLAFWTAAATATWALHLLARPLTWPVGAGLDRLVPSLWTLDLSPPLGGSEIRGLLADEETAAHLEKDEVDWARSIFELGDTEIREIMVPRIDMKAIEVSADFDAAVEQAAASRFTRLPVYDESPDHILGVLHTKDLLAAAVRGERPTIRELLRPVHFLPESKAIDEALAEFREGRIHLAVVVDEYGGTAGIVTLEDMLEEIVGDIQDEYDQEGELVRVLDERRAVVDPRIDLDDLNDALGLELPTEESDTLGGLVYQLSGKVPARGDVVRYQGLSFTIDRIERQRIRQVTLVADEPLPVARRANGSPAGEGRP